MDGGLRSRRGATDDTTTNHQQERRRGDDIGKGCNNGDVGGKGKAVAGAAATDVVVVHGSGKDVIAAAAIDRRCSQR